MIARRNILGILGGTLAIAALAISPAHAQDKPTEIRIGTQKGGFFPAVRQRHTVEDAFKPLGAEVKWIDFQFGPPLLEAINVGSVDLDDVIKSQQVVADRFARLGLIPKPVNVSDIVWKWTSGS